MPAPTTTAGFIDQYQNSQNDPQALMKLGSDENVPEQLRDRARNRAADIITQQREQAKATAELGTKTPSDLARMMQDRKKEGSWGKYVLFGALGMTALRDEEAGKLGIGHDQIVQGADGKGYLIKTGPDGRPIEGFDAQGKALTPEELITAAAGAGAGKWQTSAEFFQDKSGNVYQTQHNDKGQVRTVDAKSGAVYSGTAPLERLRDTSKLAQMGVAQGYREANIDRGVVAAIQKKRGADVMGALADYEAQSATPVTDEQRGAFIKQYGGLGVPGQAPTPTAVARPGPIAPTPIAGQAAPAAGPVNPAAPIQTAPAAPAAGVDATGTPVRLPSEGSKAFEQRYKQWNEGQESIRKTQEKAAAEIAKSAGEAVAASPQTIVNMNKIDKAVGHLDKGTTNFGAAGGGLRKGELSGETAQGIGQFLNTEDARHTQDVLEAVNAVVLERANLGKMTDADLKFYTAGKPTISDAPERVKEWLQTAKTDIKNKLEFNKQQAAGGGRAGPMEQPATPVTPPPSISAGTSQILNGVTYVYDGKGWKKK
jgi:hypothetical protein